MRSDMSQDRPRVRQLTDKVQHGARLPRLGGSQGQTEKSAQMMLELACFCSLNGPMAGVVNARRHLVGKELLALLEKLDRQNTDVVQRFQNARSIVTCQLFQRRRPLRRRGQR